ncbi:MAG: alpha-glucan family phosphorylase [Bacteroidota bacterium]
MPHNYATWNHPYTPSKPYEKRIAYFSMEFAIDQALKIYSGGLGFLSGSHMRSAFSLRQNMIGIGMLWKYGYYDQSRNEDQTLKPQFVEKTHNFMSDTGIEVNVTINGNSKVKVKAYVLKPEIFGTVPLYLLSTDVDGNDFLSRTITNYLYDANEATRIAQSIVLGIGGTKVVEALGGADVYHLNEGHGLPAFYYLRDKGINREQLAFTTHTPEKAGNTERNIHKLNHFGFFGRPLSETELKEEMVNGDMLSYTVSALRMAKKANAVSKLHGKVARNMWKSIADSCDIIPITNAQNLDFWQDGKLKKAWKNKNGNAFLKRKLELKEALFKTVLDQTGKIFDSNILTIVWARRFAGYKRADMLLYDMDRFQELINNAKYPVQIIWAGKPYPMDYYAIDVFNKLVHTTKYVKNLAVLTGYEMELSKLLKQGSDVWLNTPRITREASGTSGMSAAFNGSLNVSTDDGWIPEFKKNGKNSFVLPALDHKLPVEEQDGQDCAHLYDILEKKVVKTYYDKPEKWQQMLFKALDDAAPEFGSDRMAKQYYQELY